MQQFTKKYQLWIRDGETDAFVPTEFDTLNECMFAPKMNDWYITKRVSFNVSDSDESLPVAPTYAHPIIPAEAAVPVAEELVPEEDATLAAYLGGGVATLTTS